jgi:hypothetical protein
VLAGGRAGDDEAPGYGGIRRPKLHRGPQASVRESGGILPTGTVMVAMPAITRRAPHPR